MCPNPAPVSGSLSVASGRRWIVAILCLHLNALPALSQSASAVRTPEPLRNAIVGSVIDAASGAPLRMAQVYIDRSSAAAIGTARENGEYSVRGFRTMLTDSAGGYAFGNLQPGYYRIQIQSAGYRNSAVDVDLTGGGEVRITIGLELSPVRLPAVEVTGEPSQPFPSTLNPSTENQAARRSVVLGRQSDFLESDVRAITAGDVQEAITLAEPDLFRALQRLPGVNRRDEYTAVLWTRGAPWVQTRVYFDGMPLYNPTHGGWLFSAINPDGVGAAVFHPGVRSASWGEGAAGILDLQSRSGSPDRLMNLRGELSLASAKLSADGSLPGGASWMIAGRRTYVDLITRAWETFGGSEDTHIPYDFSDLMGRVDIPLWWGSSVEASGLLESDRLRGDVPNILVKNTADWGNRVGRITLKAPLGPMLLSATVGGTRFSTNVERNRGFGPDDEEVPTLSEMTSSIEHDRIAIRMDGPQRPLGGHSWSLGLERVRESLRYLGPFSLTGEGIPGLPVPPVEADIGPFANEYNVAWIDGRLGLIESVDLQAGLRVEDGDYVRNGGSTRVAPRISLRWKADPLLTISAGWGRSFQYTQAVGASGGPLGPQLHIGNQWVLANIGYPALRSEIFSLGAERWVDGRWLVTANTYVREVSGMAEPDPTPGLIANRVDVDYVDASSTARGFELSLRKLLGTWTGTIGYAYGTATTEAAGLEYPSSSDVRQTLDLTTTYRFPGGLGLGAAASVASGVPYTRVLVTSAPSLGAPNAHRAPAYVGFDVVLDYSTTFNDWNVDLFAQLLNVFNRSNSITYAGSSCLGDTPGAPGAECPVGHVDDDFKTGLPRLPLFGLRIAF